MKKETVKQEIAKVETKELAHNLEPWGAMEVLQDSSALLIPTATVMQKMSKMVEEDATVRPGDLRDSLDRSLLAKEGDLWEVLIIAIRAEWRVYTEAGKRVGRLTQPLNADTADLRWEFEHEGEMLKRKATYVYTVLPVSNIEATAYEFALQSSSVRTAKSLNTTLAKWARLNKHPASFVIGFSTVKTSNDSGTFWVVNFAVGREATDAEQAKAYEWNQIISRGKAKAHDESETEDREDLI